MGNATANIRTPVNDREITALFKIPFFNGMRFLNLSYTLAHKSFVMLQSLLAELLEHFGTILIAFLIMWFLSILFRPRPSIKNWNHHFAGMQFTSREVYEKIVNEINKRKIPGLAMGYLKTFEAGIFSPRREYLTIQYKKFNLDVCCMSYGTGYYMSWWLRRDDDRIIAQIPVLRDIFGCNPQYPSYYQLDTAALFQSGIHDAILSVIDEITSEKGLRGLTELERQPFSRIF